MPVTSMSRNTVADTQLWEPTAPERSLQQRRDALKTANHTRAARAKLKKELQAGSTSIYDVLLDPYDVLLDTPDYLMTMKVGELLQSQRRWGPVKVAKVLKRCGISPSRTFGGLTRRQRDELVRAIVLTPRP